MGLYSGGLIIGRIFASEIWRAYFREGLLSEFLRFIESKQKQVSLSGFRALSIPSRNVYQGGISGFATSF